MDYLTAADQDLAAATAHEEEVHAQAKAIRAELARVARIPETAKEIAAIREKVRCVFVCVFLCVYVCVCLCVCVYLFKCV